MKNVYLTIISVMISISALFAADIDSVKAYPVPFNPNVTSVLKIDGFTGTAKITIYDVNGDQLYSTTASGSASWSGRNDKGRLVAPGMYIIKVELDSSGNYGRKLIRILISY